jgi:hypothetical protein
MASAPLCGVFTGVAIEDGEEALAADTAKVNYERVGVLHCSPGTLIFGNTDLVSGILYCMPIQNTEGIQFGGGD